MTEPKFIRPSITQAIIDANDRHEEIAAERDASKTHCKYPHDPNVIECICGWINPNPPEYERG